MATTLLLKKEPGRPTERPKAEDRAGTGEDSGRVLICAACLHAITTGSARVEKDGRHAHTFSNPHGFVFHIGCFATAPGCDTEGEPTTEHTWFPGHAWQVEACRGCGRHMGWLFTASDTRFHALILDRLAETEGHGPSH